MSPSTTPRSMREHGMLAIFLVLAIAFSGCFLSVLGPDDEPLDLPDVYRILWDLDDSSVAPFTLIFDEEQFYGYDGCNWFGARFSVEQDSIRPRDMAQTQRACNVATFPLFRIAHPFVVRITRDRLRIIVNDDEIVFRTGFGEPVAESGPPGDWELTASNDAEFQMLREQDLLPNLKLLPDRTFRLQWNCQPENPWGCDEVTGLYGLGENGKFRFYAAGRKTHAAGLDMVERILLADSYEVVPGGSAGNSLILTAADGRTSYTFTPMVPEGAAIRQ